MSLVLNLQIATIHSWFGKIQTTKMLAGPDCQWQRERKKRRACRRADPRAPWVSNPEAGEAAALARVSSPAANPAHSGRATYTRASGRWGEPIGGVNQRRGGRRRVDDSERRMAGGVLRREARWTPERKGKRAGEVHQSSGMLGGRLIEGNTAGFKVHGELQRRQWQRRRWQWFCGRGKERKDNGLVGEKLEDIVGAFIAPSRDREPPASSRPIATARKEPFLCC
jgi:hypothetical protein